MNEANSNTTMAVQARETNNQVSAPMTADEIVGQVTLIQQIMARVMKDGEHYGSLKGCGDRKTLLKPGAEKLSMTFRLRAEFDVQIIDMTRGHREYRIICSLYNINTGNPVGQGLGSCSTMECKYRYRTERTGQAVPREYWENGRSKDWIGGDSFDAKKIDGEWQIIKQIEYENPADYYNTCLKMAKKRAHVDAILTATAASDIFTQDVEEGLPGAADDDSGTLPKQQANGQTNGQREQAATATGNWMDVVIHWTQNHKGKRLGDVSIETLKWFAEQWELKPYNGKINPLDTKLKAAAQAGYHQVKSEAQAAAV